MGGKRKSFPSRLGAHEFPEELHMQRPTRLNRGRDGAGSASGNTRRGSWSLPEDLCFLAVLRAMMLANNSDHDSISRAQWEILLSQYNERTPGDKVDKHQLYCRLKTLKQSYNLNCALRSKRGWTWDDTKQMAVAPNDNAWEELIEHNKQFRKIRRKPFPQYDTMDQIFGKSIASDLREESANSASSKEEIFGVDKGNGVQYVLPISQMPPNLIHAQEQSPAGGDEGHTQEQSPVGGDEAHTQEQSPVEGDEVNLDCMSPGSNSSRKQLGNKSGSAKRRRTEQMFTGIGCEMLGLLGGEHERIQCIDRYLRHCESWKHDLREVMKKIRSVPGISIKQRVAGMEACTNPMTREMVKIFDPDELRYWLEKFGTQPRGAARYPESFEVHERVVLPPGGPVPDPATCDDDLVKTSVLTEITRD